MIDKADKGLIMDNRNNITGNSPLSARERIFKENRILKDKLHRRNMQIKDLKKQLKKAYETLEDMQLKELQKVNCSICGKVSCNCK